jgi:hypothetical protein
MKFTEKDLKVFLKNEQKEYVASIGTLTAEEHKELCEWVAGRNSPFDNPWHICGEQGHLMDFITAIRISEAMRNNPSDYVQYANATLNSANEEELPF